jgi:hypothetical protein
MIKPNTSSRRPLSPAKPGSSKTVPEVQGCLQNRRGRRPHGSDFPAAAGVSSSIAHRIFAQRKWTEVSEVLLYPDDFDRDYAIGRRELAGSSFEGASARRVR